MCAHMCLWVHVSARVCVHVQKLIVHNVTVCTCARC